MTAMPAPVETVLRRRFAGHEWQPTQHGNRVGAAVHRLAGGTDLYVKWSPCTAAPDPGISPCAEAERLAWLARQGIGCPEVVDTGTVDEHEYLVTTAAPGVPANRARPAGDLFAVCDAIADFAADLHRLPVADCPFDRRLRVRVPQAHEAAALGDIDLADVSPPWRGRTVVGLLTELVTAARRVGREEPVVCHGEYCLPNILIDPDTWTVSAIVDVGRLGVADRYTDLALITRSMTTGLHPQYGRDHADRFMYRYGELPADGDRITLYRLLDEFCC